MKKGKIFLTLLVLLLSSALAKAGTLSPYSFGFDDRTLIGDEESVGYGSMSFVHDFAPLGWSHVIDYYSGNYRDSYVSYSFSSNQGVDGTGALLTSSQLVYDDSYDDYPLYDLLVTPLVSGTVTIDAKWGTIYSSYANRCFLEVYTMTKNGDTWTRGEKLTPTAEVTLNGDEYQTVTYNLSEGTYLGIRASYLYIDNFTATSAEIEDKQSLKISKVTSNNPQYADADEEGNMSLAYTVSLLNNGSLDLAEGTENYSLSLLKGENGPVIATQPITAALATGKGADVEFNVTFNIADYAEPFTSYVRENITNTNAKGSDVTPVANKGVMKISTEGTIDFGSSQKEVVRQISIENTGGKTLNVTAVTVPEGFEVVTALPLTIEPHQAGTLEVKMLATTAGTYEGRMSITASDDNTATLQLNGVVVDPSAWYVDFEDCSSLSLYEFPAGMYPDRGNASQTAWQISSYPTVIGLENNKNCAYHTQLSNECKLISPLLQVGEGESISFDAAKVGKDSYMNIYISTDRKNWTKVYAINVTGEGADAQFGSENLGSSWNERFNFTRFTVSGIPAGEWYVAFESGYAYLDNILGFKSVAVTHDLVLSSQNLPKSGTVNNALNATAAVYNTLADTEAAGTYTARYYVGGEVAAEAASVDLKHSVNANFAFAYTPHEAGTFETYIELEFEDGYKLTSDKESLTVAEEEMIEMHQVGDASIENSTNKNGALTPIDLYCYNSESANLLPAAAVNLPAGTQLKSIQLRGAVQKSLNVTNLKIWIANTDIAALPDMPNTNSLDDVMNRADMTLVYDDEAYVKHNSDSYTGYNDNQITLTVSGDLVTVTFAEPFVYTGGNLLIMFKSNLVNTYTKSYFEVDPNYADMSVARSHDNATTLASTVWYKRPMPAIYFGIDAVAPEYSGKVTDKASGNALSGVTVELKSDNVLYSGVSDSDGKFSIPVVQKDKAYTVEVNHEGYLPYSKPLSLAEGNVERDIVLETATGLFLTDFSIPAAGEINSLYGEATSAVTNVIETDIAADEYTATLYFDDEAVATAEVSAIAVGESANHTFSFVPHKAGTFQARIKYVYKEFEYETDAVEVTIGEEKMNSEATAGTRSGTSTTGFNTPVHLWYKHSQSEILYKPEDIHITKGTVIKEIAFKGTPGSNNQTIRLTAYMEQTEEGLHFDESEKFVGTDVSGMTKIFDGEINITSTDYQNVISIPLGESVAYEGKNIRICMTATVTGGSTVNCLFDYDDNVTNQAYGKRTDGTEEGALDAASWGECGKLPVMYMQVENKKTLSGTVTDKQTGAAIAGATVKVTSGDVEYTATTDSEGKYEVAVGKLDLTYTAEASAEGYNSQTQEDISFAEGDVDLNFELEAIVVVNITNAAADMRNLTGKVYDINGRFVGENIGTKALPRGIYIVNGEKITVK